MPSWLKDALRRAALWALEQGVKALGGKTYDEGYQAGFKAACAEQETKADESIQRARDAVAGGVLPDAGADPNNRDNQHPV